jgi:NADH-quinone oxidoreductase subunit J
LAFVLLGALLYALEGGSGHPVRHTTVSRPTITTNELSRPAADEPVGTMRGLGRSLFGDYLFAVELAGTLLLIASIGAIAMAPRRAEGTL